MSENFQDTSIVDITDLLRDYFDGLYQGDVKKFRISMQDLTNKNEMKTILNIKSKNEELEKAAKSLGKDIKFALDVAASEFYDDSTGTYKLKSENKKLT